MRLAQSAGWFLVNRLAEARLKFAFFSAHWYPPRHREQRFMSSTLRTVLVAVQLGQSFGADMFRDFRGVLDQNKLESWNILRKSDIAFLQTVCVFCVRNRSTTF